MKKKIVITGGTGLMALNWAIKKRAKSDVILLQHNRKVKLNGTVFLQIALENKKEILATLKELKPDLLVHTAGLTNIELCEREPEKAHFTNVILSSNLAQVCSEQKIQFVHISTDHLFDGKSSFYKEIDKTNPVNEYAKSKFAAEQAVLSENDLAIVVRTNIFGWGTSYRKSFSDFIIENLRKEKEITLFNDVYYTPILISDLVDQIDLLINLKAKGVFNIVGKERMSKYEFGMLVSQIFNLDSQRIKSCSINSKADLVHRPRDMSLCGSKISQLTGENLPSIKQGIQQLFQQEVQGQAKELGAL